MPNTYTKVKLSGSTDGRGIKIAATGSPGTTIHTADPTALDEIWIYIYNSDTVSREATVQLGGTTSPDDDVKMTIPAKSGRYLVIEGQPLTNTVIVKAYCVAAANVLVATGYVNRIT